MRSESEEITIIPQALCMNKFHIKIPKNGKSNSLRLKENKDSLFYSSSSD
jgi:hypothetical protein